MTNQRHIWGVVCFSAAFLYCMIFIWQGLDVTDDGFQLTHQYTVISYGLEYGFPPVWLSEIAGGLWLYLTDDIGLIGARVGWALGIAVTSLATYILLSCLFSPRHTAISVLLAVPLASFAGQMVFNYYYFPALLLVLLVGSLFICFRAETEKRGKTTWIVISGFMLALCIFARGSLLTVIVLPVLMWLCFRIAGIKHENEFKTLLLIYLTAFLVFAIAALYVFIAGHWEQYYQSVTQVGSKRGANFGRALIRQLSATFHESIKILLVTLAGGLIYRLCVYKSNFLGWLVLFITGMSLVYVVYTAKHFWMALYGAIYVFGLIAFLLVWLLIPKTEQKRTEIMTLLVFGALMPAMITFGASSVLWKMHYGFWLLLPLVPLSLLATENMRAGSLKFSDRDHKYLVRFFVVMVCVISLIAVYFRIENPYYRDSSFRTRLVAPIEHPRLAGIYTTPERARSFSDLVNEVDKVTEPGDKILVYNSIPLLYFITKTVPLFKRNWLIIANTTPEAVQALADSLCNGTDSSRKNIPKIIVRALVNTRDPEWGLKKTKPILHQFEPLLDILDKGIEKCKPETVWSNHDFIIYRPTI